jgi:hypothetical protein
MPSNLVGKTAEELREAYKALKGRLTAEQQKEKADLKKALKSLGDYGSSASKVVRVALSVATQQLAQQLQATGQQATSLYRHVSGFLQQENQTLKPLGPVGTAITVVTGAGAVVVGIAALAF